MAGSTLPSKDCKTLLSAFGSCDVEKAHMAVAGSIFRSRNNKITTCSDPFLDVEASFWHAQEILRLAKSEQNMRVLQQKRWRRAVQETHESDMFGGPSLLDNACFLLHPILRFAKLILRDRCSTSYDSTSLLVADVPLDTRGGKIAKYIGSLVASFALNFPFLKEVSQNCFVFCVAAVNFGSLAASLLGS